MLAHLSFSKRDMQIHGRLYVLFSQDNKLQEHFRSSSSTITDYRRIFLHKATHFDALLR